MEVGPSVITDLQGAFRLHYTCHRIASVVFGFPAKVSWPNIASLPRNVSSSSKQIPSEVNDFPIPIVFSRHWGHDAPHAPAIYVPGGVPNHPHTRTYSRIYDSDLIWMKILKI